MKTNKFFIIPFVAVLVLLFVFVSTQIPTAHQSVKNLPIALINEDTGEMGQTIVQQIQDNSKKQSNVEWVLLDSQKEMNAEMVDQNIYGAIVIPADFSQTYASLQSPTPMTSEILLFVNQGKNTMVSTVVTQTLSGMVTNMSHMMGEKILATMESNQVPLSVEQARIYTAPISSTTTMVHETGNLGNAPLSLFQPLWLASIVSAVMLWFATKERNFLRVTDQLKFRAIQVLLTVVLGFVAGFALTWFTTFMLDYEFESFRAVALFLSITCMSFILLILAVISWIGIGGVVLFVLLMFFGLPVLQLAPEMLPAFYQDWIHPWLPMRFMFDGIREILFFDGGVWNKSAVVLVWTAIVSMLLLLGKVITMKKEIREKAQ